MLKIAITGPESSGKSTLAQNLAAHFRVPYVPEYAREYLSRSSGTYLYEDLEKIFLGQMALEAVVDSDISVKMVFCDTDVLVIRIWSMFRFGKLAQVIDEAFRSERYDHYLLCRPDIIWEPDPFRESPLQEERDRLFDMYKEALDEIKAPYTIIDGNHTVRMEKAMKAINALAEN